MMDKQQKNYTTLYMLIKAKCEELSCDFYDGVLPDESAGYPFAYMGENSTTDRETKTAAMEEVKQTIHVYASKDMRGTLSNIMHEIKLIARKTFDVKGIETQVLIDKTTSEPLYHGVIDLTI